MDTRRINRIVSGKPASDGAGVKLNRVFSPGCRFDPFLMLDEFNSDEAADYIAGFPAHPHRGFETVTYMLEGEMLHEDHLGNRGRLTSGSVQWMTAGRGIIHSEMPQQQDGRMRGFQLWLNLPAAEKMKPAAYRDIRPEEIPTVALPTGPVKVIAGRFRHEQGTQVGAVSGLATDPLVLDVTLGAAASLRVPVEEGYTALAYCFQGECAGGEASLRRGQMAVFDEQGDVLALSAGAEGARVLVLAAKPLREPVAHYGPFVMNTIEEVEQALRDFRNGRLAG
jgi:quercetin 2,3-dioxygenase